MASSLARVSGGSDPLNADTNGNGVSDGVETHHGATDADNPDTDGDGMANWLEVQAGTDPFNTDSDGDTVVDGSDAFPSRSHANVGSDRQPERYDAAHDHSDRTDQRGPGSLSEKTYAYEDITHLHLRAIVWALVAGQMILTVPVAATQSAHSGKMEPWTWKFAPKAIRQSAGSAGL